MTTTIDLQILLDVCYKCVEHIWICVRNVQRRRGVKHQTASNDDTGMKEDDWPLIVYPAKL